MAIVTATAVITHKNYHVCIPHVHTSLFNLKLIHDLTYDIGIDQSSSCTGIAIRSIDKDINILIDIRRDCGDKESFYREVKGILRGLITGLKIRSIVCEDPPPVTGKRYASAILLELRGIVSGWVETIPELAQAEFSSVYPQTWKSFIVDKSKGKGRSNIKACIAEDICDIVPGFNQYRTVYASNDYDSFDAFGILAGYQMYAYTDEGLPLICGKIESRHRAFVGYRYVSVSEIQNGTVNDFFGPALGIFKPKYLVYNTRYNKFKNVRMATSNYDCSYTILPDEQLDVLKWKYDLERKDGYVLMAWLFNYSHYPRATQKALENSFRMSEEVNTC